MNPLSLVFVLKIAATILFWCIPLLLFPASVLELGGFPPQDSYMFVRMLGWAYLALCVGYAFGLQASLAGQRLMPPIWVGMVSNGGAAMLLFYYGLSGTWSGWGRWIQFTGWASAGAALLITLGLVRYGLFGQGPVVAGASE